MAFYSEDHFLALSGFHWHDEPEARAAGYALQEIVEPGVDGRFSEEMCRLFQLIYFEPNFRARHALLSIIEQRVEAGQAENPQIPNGWFFERIMALGDRVSDGPFCLGLIKLGLGTLERGWQLYPLFFDWANRRMTLMAQNMSQAIDTLPLDHRDHPDYERLEAFGNVLGKIKELVKRDPGMAIPAYVDLCCFAVALPLSLRPVALEGGQTYHDKKLERLKREQVQLNKAIEQIHPVAVNAVRETESAAKEKKVPYYAHLLFSPHALRLLNRAEEVAKVGVNKVMLPSIHRDVKIAAAISKPMSLGRRRLTHSPALPPDRTTERLFNDLFRPGPTVS